MANTISDIKEVEEVSVSVNIEELVMSLENSNEEHPQEFRAGFAAPKK